MYHQNLDAMLLLQTYIDLETYAFVKESYLTKLSCKACNKSSNFLGVIKLPFLIQLFIINNMNHFGDYQAVYLMK